MSGIKNARLVPAPARPSSPCAEEEEKWFVLRDLRRGPREPAFETLRRLGFEVFVPMRWRRGRTEDGSPGAVLAPSVRSLLFVKAARSALDAAMAKAGRLQYLYVRGGGYCVPATVRSRDMERFVAAVRSADDTQWYTAEEAASLRPGPAVRVVGGSLDGCEGLLLTRRGSRVKRLLVRLPGSLCAGVRIGPGSSVEKA